MGNILNKIVIDEISGVRKPANKHARVLLLKSLDEAKYDSDAGEAMQKALDDGLFDELEKSDIEALIQVRADEIRKPGEKKAAAYARAVSEDPIGKVMFHAVKRAMGCEPTSAAIQRAQEEVAKARATAPKPPKPFKEMSVNQDVKMPVSTAGRDTPEAEEKRTVAELKMHNLAVDNARAHNSPYASAYARVYSHPDNRELRAQVQADHLARALRGVGGA